MNRILLAVFAMVVSLSAIGSARAVNDGLWMSFTYSVGVKYLDVLEAKYTDAPYPKSLQMPDYPMELMRAAAGGEVTLTFLVTERGEVKDVTVEKGIDLFAAAAKRAVAKWSFYPGAIWSGDKRTNIPGRMRCIFTFSAKEVPNHSPGPTPSPVH